MNLLLFPGSPSQLVQRQYGHVFLHIVDNYCCSCCNLVCDYYRISVTVENDVKFHCPQIWCDLNEMDWQRIWVR